MSIPLAPDALKARLACGLLGFPVTDFAADGAFSAQPFGERVRRMSGEGCAALFIAGGAGELFSLTAAEQEAVLATALSARAAGVPIIAAAGGATLDAIAQVRMAERLGADGVLLLPPYLAEASQEGLAAHVAAVCGATGLGVILYSRANGRVRPATLARLAEARANLVALKDGVGDVEELWAMRLALGGRLAFVNGMPTAELYAPAYRAMGAPTYSSAIYNFAPRAAMAFFAAVQTGDAAFIDRMMGAFLLPYGRIRARQPGYAVSIVKAGVDLVGRSAGPVRPPLSDLTPEERAELAPLVQALASVEETDHVRAA